VYCTKNTHSTRAHRAILASFSRFDIMPKATANTALCI